MRDDLATLLPPAGEITVAGRAIVIAPAPAFKLLHIVVPLVLDGLLVLGGNDDGAELGLLGPQAPALVAALAGQPVEWVEALPADEGQRLTEALLRVNADFFIRQLPPAIARVVRSLTAGKSNAPAPTAKPTTPTLATDGLSPPNA